MKNEQLVEVVSLYEDAHAYSAEMEQEVLSDWYQSYLTRVEIALGDEDGALLDVACGTGHFLREYSLRNGNRRKLIGIDASLGMLAQAKIIAEGRADFYLGDMIELTTIDSETVFTVISSFAIQHLNEQALMQALKEWKRVLEPGGKLIITAWNGEGLIDYGSDIALKAHLYSLPRLCDALRKVEMQVNEAMNIERPSPDIEMDGLYIEAQKTRSL